MLPKLFASHRSLNGKDTLYLLPLSSQHTAVLFPLCYREMPSQYKRSKQVPAVHAFLSEASEWVATCCAPTDRLASSASLFQSSGVVSARPGSLRFLLMGRRKRSSVWASPGTPSIEHSSGTRHSKRVADETVGAIKRAQPTWHDAVVQKG